MWVPPHGLCTWASLGSPQHGAWDLRARVPKEGDERKLNPFMTQPWRSHSITSVMLHCMMPSEALTKIRGRGGGHKPSTPWRRVYHTVGSTCGMGFGIAIFGKLNLPT